MRNITCHLRSSIDASSLQKQVPCAAQIGKFTLDNGMHSVRMLVILLGVIVSKGVVAFYVALLAGGLFVFLLATEVGDQHRVKVQEGIEQVFMDVFDGEQGGLFK